jgi:hypothetical protein
VPRAASFHGGKERQEQNDGGKEDHDEHNDGSDNSAFTKQHEHPGAVQLDASAESCGRSKSLNIRREARQASKS